MNELKQSETERKQWLEQLQKENLEREKKHKEYLKEFEEERKEREKKHREENAKTGRIADRNGTR